MAPRKKRTENSKILRYPDSSMQSAIAAVREGRFKIREASRHYGVPHSTLINKLKGRVAEVRKMGRDTYLTKSEELLLKNYIIAKAKRGIHITRTTLLDTVQKIIKDDKRVTPFKNYRPGRKWIELFFKRHPELTEKKAEGISTARANVTIQDIKDWHNSLREYLARENCLDILEDPKRIFNADESGFQTCPQSGKVLGPVGMRNFYEIKSGKEKEQLTVMVTINAAGQIVSPMIVYPLIKVSKEISNNVPDDWAIGKSKSGWMTGPCYYEFIANVFDPWIKANKIKKPVLLLIDGHRSHMTLQVSQYCEQNGIIAYALFPNSTHVCQPADVSVFKCLKSGWIKTVHEYKQNTGNRHITRAGFAPLLSVVFRDKVTPNVVKNGFMKCGIYSFDISAIDFTRCMDDECRKAAPLMQSTLETEVGVEVLLMVESFMRSGRAQQFRQTRDEHWTGDESAKELFYVWKKLRQRCLANALFDEIPTENHVDVSKTEEAVSNSNIALAVSPSIIQKSPGLYSQNFGSSEIGISSEKTPGNGNVEMTTTDGSPIIAPNVHLKPFSDNNKQTETHSPDPDTPPLEQDVPIVESQTPTRFLSPIPSPIMHTPTIRSPIRTPTIHLEKTSASDSCQVQNITIDSTKLVQLIGQKQKQISPAFGKHLLWPSDSPLKKKKTERLPFATTSKKWQDYWLSKEKEKKEKIEKVENRKRIREEKRLNKIKGEKEKNGKKIQTENKRKTIMKKFFLSDNSDSDASNDDSEAICRKVPNKRRIIRSDTSDSDTAQDEKQDPVPAPSTFNKGDFVIFSYDGSYYVGRIEDLSAVGALIKSMKRSLNNWKWPEKEDLNLYSISDIKEIIKEPQVINLKRGTFYVEEFKKYCDFI